MWKSKQGDMFYAVHPAWPVPDLLHREMPFDGNEAAAVFG